MEAPSFTVKLPFDIDKVKPIGLYIHGKARWKETTRKTKTYVGGQY
jgi:hypothetical protein